jgi:integrase
VHIAPALGHLKLKSLSPIHLRGLYRERLDSGLAPRTVQYIHTTLHKALKQAVNDGGLIPRNVAEAVKPPRPAKKEIQPLNAEQAHTFLEAARGDRFEALYVLAITTGLREGELLGLKWEDLQRYS